MPKMARNTEWSSLRKLQISTMSDEEEPTERQFLNDRRGLVPRGAVVRYDDLHVVLDQRRD